LDRDIDLAGEVGVRLDGACTALAALDVFTLGTAQQDADVVACLTLVKHGTFQRRCKWSFACHYRRNLRFFADDNTALDTAGHDLAAEMENTSSTGIRKAPSMARFGMGMWCVGRQRLHDGFFAQRALSPSAAGCRG
jgi:hypothetical protein